MMQCHFCVNLLVSVFGHTVHWNVLLPDIQHSPFTCGALECFTARHTTFTLYLWCFGMFYCQTYNIHLVPVVLWNGLLPYIQHSPFTCGAECFCILFFCFLFAVQTLPKSTVTCSTGFQKYLQTALLMIMYNTFTECVHSLLTMYGTFKDIHTTPY